jgi:hypothetical protein
VNQADWARMLRVLGMASEASASRSIEAAEEWQTPSRGMADTHLVKEAGVTDTHFFTTEGRAQ